MKPASLYHALGVSVALHVLTVITALFIASRSIVQKAPLPYIVSLVSDAPTFSGAASSAPVKEAPARPKEAERVPVRKESPQTVPKPKENAAKKEDDSRVRDVIESIQAKKRLEKIVALRKTIDVGGSTAQTPKNQPAATAEQRGTGGGKVTDYYTLVVQRIRQRWVFPETIDRNLEAVVAIRVAHDGRVTIERMEKGSGNSLFDRSVLRAINLASPLPPPPQEMEIGVRFTP
jgi:colicin import membrane protein